MLPLGTIGPPPSAVMTPRIFTLSPLLDIAPAVLLQLNAPLSVRFLRKLNFRLDALLAVVLNGASSSAVVTGTSRFAPLIVSRTVSTVTPASVWLGNPSAARRSAPLMRKLYAPLVFF